jgi:hypothetical protein
MEVPPKCSQFRYMLILTCIVFHVYASTDVSDEVHRIQKRKVTWSIHRLNVEGVALITFNDLLAVIRLLFY